MSATTISLEPEVRDRLRTFGSAGMTYSEILQALMDQVDREHFVAELHRRADAVKGWVPLEDVE